MNTPNFLRNLLQSNNYLNKNSNEYKKANEYLQSLFPGQIHLDVVVFLFMVAQNRALRDVSI